MLVSSEVVKPGPDSTDVDFSLGQGVSGSSHHLLPLVAGCSNLFPPPPSQTYISKRAPQFVLHVPCLPLPTFSSDTAEPVKAKDQTWENK